MILGTGNEATIEITICEKLDGAATLKVLDEADARAPHLSTKSDTMIFKLTHRRHNGNVTKSG